MKTYTVYTRQEVAVVAIKQGFSWPAFFFGPIWALVKGFFGLFAGLVVLSAGLTVLQEAIIPAYVPDRISAFFQIIVGFAAIGIMLLMGENANHLWRRRLLKRGYQNAGDVKASSATAAIGAFRKSHPEIAEPAGILECPSCSSMIPPGESKCPKCGWE
jgi:hypothetical protein